MEGVSRTEFAEAVAAAITGVQHFYREVDSLVISLRDALRHDPPLKMVRGSTGKGTSVKEGRLVLRDEYNMLFVEEERDAGEPDDEEEDEEEDPEDVDDAPARSKRRHSFFQLDLDRPVMALRVSLFEIRRTSAYEPHLQYGILSDWGLGKTGAKPVATFAINHHSLRRIPWVLEGGRQDSNLILTEATVVKGKGKVAGADRRISCRIRGGVRTVALYDLDAPAALDDLAMGMKEHWRKIVQEQ